MVLTPPIVFAQTDGIESVLLDHTRTRGPSVAHMRDFFKEQFSKDFKANLVSSEG